MMRHQYDASSSARGWKIGGALLASPPAWTTVYEVAATAPASAPAAASSISVTPANYPAGTATYVTEGRLYVANAGGQLFALSQKCPHLGCRVAVLRALGTLRVPVPRLDVRPRAASGSQGRRRSGMDRYDHDVEDGDSLVVDTSKLTAGPDRGAHEYLTPPKGPSCHREA